MGLYTRVVNTCLVVFDLKRKKEKEPHAFLLVQHTPSTTGGDAGAHSGGPFLVRCTGLRHSLVSVSAAGEPDPQTLAIRRSKSRSSEGPSFGCLEVSPVSCDPWCLLHLCILTALPLALGVYPRSHIFLKDTEETSCQLPLSLTYLEGTCWILDAESPSQSSSVVQSSKQPPPPLLHLGPAHPGIWVGSGPWVPLRWALWSQISSKSKHQDVSS